MLSVIYAECHFCLVSFMLSVIYGMSFMLSVTKSAYMLKIIMLSLFMLSVVALIGLTHKYKIWILMVLGETH